MFQVVPTYKLPKKIGVIKTDYTQNGLISQEKAEDFAIN